MERIEVKDIEPWFLSGEPVVRFAGRDFSQTVPEYMDWLSNLAEAIGLGLHSRSLADPPGVVFQTFVPGAEPAPLEDPMIKVTRSGMPWLFCLQPKCRVRVDVPGMMCKAHPA